MRFHALADSDWRPPTPAEVAVGWRWRHRVDVAFAGADSRVALSLTAPRENHAAVPGLVEALAPTWADHRRLADAGWLTPWLQVLAGTQGRRAHDLEGEILDAFAQRHGRAATSYRWDV